MSFTEIRTDYLIGFPISLHPVGYDSIIVNDSKGNEHIALFNLTDGSRLYATDANGMGPDEVTLPIRLAVSGDSIYVLSLATKTVHSGDIKNPLLTVRTQMPKEVMGLYYLPRHKIFISPVMSLDDTTDENTYAYIFDSNFNKIQDLKGFAQLWDKEKSYPFNAVSKFHQIQGICETDDNRIAILESHILRLFTFEANKLIPVSDCLLFPYEYTFSAKRGNSVVPTTRLADGIIKGGKDIASKGNTILISVDTNIKGDEPSDNHVKLLQLDSNGKLIAEYITHLLLNPYPLTVTKNGKIVMFSDGEDLSLAFSSYPNP